MKKKWLPIFVIFQVLNVMVCSYLSIKKVLNMYKLSRIYIGLLIVNIIVMLVITVIKHEKKKKILNKRTLIYLIFIIIFSLISACFAVNKKSAFFGFSGRYEGFFQIMYYFSLFLLTTFVDKKDKKKIVYAIVFSCLVECIYAIFQVTEVIPVFTQYQHGKAWATGFATNPNFFGTLMLIGLTYSIGLFIDSKEKRNRCACAALITVFMIGLLISNTLSVAVGLFVVYIYVLIYCIKNKKKYILMILTVILLSTTILIHLTGHTNLIKSVIKTKDETIEIAKGHIDDTYGTKRIYIWRHTLWVVPKNLLHGVGIDNFYYAFGSKPLSMGRWFFDKAHNEYLQILICEGIFALIAYLLFYASITFRGIKNSYKKKEIYLILPVIGYLVQAFFNISVIEVAPFFYVALGLLIDRKEI